MKTVVHWLPPTAEVGIAPSGQRFASGGYMASHRRGPRARRHLEFRHARVEVSAARIHGPKVPSFVQRPCLTKGHKNDTFAYQKTKKIPSMPAFTRFSGVVLNSASEARRSSVILGYTCQRSPKKKFRQMDVNFTCFSYLIDHGVFII